MKQLIVLVFASLSIWVAGCSTAKIADYQPSSASGTERTAQASGAEVAIDPFVENGRTSQYFDVDALAEGIAILHVRVANRTADQTFLVEKKDFQLLADVSGGGLTGDAKTSRDHPVVNNLAAVGGVVGSTAIGLFVLSMNSHSSEIQRNFTGKEMADATLSPGRSMEGFIYFAPVKKGEDWSRAGVVKVSLTDTRTRQAIALTIPLSHQPSNPQHP